MNWPCGSNSFGGDCISLMCRNWLSKSRPIKLETTKVFTVDSELRCVKSVKTKMCVDSGQPLLS